MRYPRHGHQARRPESRRLSPSRGGTAEVRLSAEGGNLVGALAQNHHPIRCILARVLVCFPLFINELS